MVACSTQASFGGAGNRHRPHRRMVTWRGLDRGLTGRPDRKAMRSTILGLLTLLVCAACGGGTGPEPEEVFDWPGAYAGKATVQAWPQVACGPEGCDPEPLAATECTVSLELVPGADSGVTGVLELSRCVEWYRDPDWTPPRIPFLRMGSFGAIEGKSFPAKDPLMPWSGMVYAGGGEPLVLADGVGCTPRGTWQSWFLGLHPYQDGPDPSAVETMLGTLQYFVEGTDSRVGEVPLTCAGVDVQLSLVLLVEKVIAE